MGNITEQAQLCEDIRNLGEKDAQQLAIKNGSYGDSWKRRGGVGAFMMLARKWDRLELQCSAKGYDIFAAVLEDSAGITTQDGVIDDIRDLRRYLLLVEHHLLDRVNKLALLVAEANKQIAAENLAGPVDEEYQPKDCPWTVPTK